MKKIILISDTHSYVGKDSMKYIEDCDEIWHAGDIGDPAVISLLESTGKILRIVSGNIDTNEVQEITNDDLLFTCEGVKVYMIHIGGYPGRYVKKIRKKLKEIQPDLYICGHSHILKVMRDKENGFLHFNPGAIGLSGFNKFRTLLSFECSNGKIENLKAVELGERTRPDKDNHIIFESNWSKVKAKSKIIS